MGEAVVGAGRWPGAPSCPRLLTFFFACMCQHFCVTLAQPHPCLLNCNVTTGRNHAMDRSRRRGECEGHRSVGLVFAHLPPSVQLPSRTPPLQLRQAPADVCAAQHAQLHPRAAPAELPHGGRHRRRHRVFLAKDVVHSSQRGHGRQRRQQRLRGLRAANRQAGAWAFLQCAVVDQGQAREAGGGAQRGTALQRRLPVQQQLPQAGQERGEGQAATQLVVFNVQALEGGRAGAAIRNSSTFMKPPSDRSAAVSWDPAQCSAGRVLQKAYRSARLEQASSGTGPRSHSPRTCSRDMAATAGGTACRPLPDSERKARRARGRSASQAPGGTAALRLKALCRYRMRRPLSADTCGRVFETGMWGSGSSGVPQQMGWKGRTTAAGGARRLRVEGGKRCCV